MVDCAKQQMMALVGNPWNKIEAPPANLGSFSLPLTEKERKDGFDNYAE